VEEWPQEGLMDDCTHLDLIDPAAKPSAEGCEDCLRDGGRWVHLRMCRSCGHVGCCDSSPNKHASKHAATGEHPLVSSFEPGEDWWWWCYVDDMAFALPSEPRYSHP
jgi:hypothetical protein